MAILGLGWTLLINGSAIVFCPPPCPYAAPLSDVAHVGSLVLGLAAPVAAIWALWRRRVRVSWALPTGALVLVVAVVVVVPPPLKYCARHQSGIPSPTESRKRFAAV